MAVILNGHIAGLTVEDQIRHPPARVGPVVADKPVSVGLLAHIVVHAETLGLQAFDQVLKLVYLAEGELADIEIHTTLGHVGLIVVHEEDDGLSGDGKIEEDAGIVRDQGVHTVQEFILVHSRRKWQDVPVAVQLDRLLDDGMEVDVELLPVGQGRVDLPEHGVHFLAVIGKVNVVIALPAPGGHVGQGRKAVIAKLRPHGFPLLGV